MKLSSSLLLLLLMTGCSSDPGDSFEGTWSMVKVVQDGQDVTSEHDPHKERFIVFKADSTFLSGGRPFGENTGKYMYHSDKQTLFLDSDAGPDDDSHWKVTLEGDTMHWQGYGSAWAEGFELIHVRKWEK